MSTILRTPRYHVEFLVAHVCDLATVTKCEKGNHTGKKGESENNIKQSLQRFKQTERYKNDKYNSSILFLESSFFSKTDNLLQQFSIDLFKRYDY